MPRISRHLPAYASVALLALGCGTLVNVTAPTTASSGYRAFGPTACEPFGGVKRSVMAGSMPLMAGPIGIIPAALAVGIDTPLSLVGDVVTLPIVYYRLRPQRPDNQPTTPRPSEGGQQAETPQHTSEP